MSEGKEPTEEEIKKYMKEHNESYYHARRKIKRASLWWKTTRWLPIMG